MSVSLDKKDFDAAVKASGYQPTDAQYDGFKSAIDRFKSVTSITSKQEWAMFLANVMHESGGFKYKAEIDGPTKKYAPYYGRGYIQLTHDYNYRDASKALLGDAQVLLKDPDLIVRDEALAWGTAFWFWHQNVHSRVQGGDFEESIRAINSIELESKATDEQKKQAQHRRDFYSNVKEAWRL